MHGSGNALPRRRSRLSPIPLHPTCLTLSNLACHATHQVRLEEMETELLELNSNTERLMRSYAELDEMHRVLDKAGSSFFDAKSKLGARGNAEVTMESYERSFGENPDAPLLENGVS